MDDANVDKKSGDFLISVYPAEDGIKTEITNNSSSKTEIYDKVHRNLETLSEKFEEVEENFKQYDGAEEATGEDLDLDKIESAVTEEDRSNVAKVRAIVDDLGGKDNSARVDKIKKEAKEKGIDSGKVEEILENLKRDGEAFEPKEDHVTLI